MGEEVHAEGRLIETSVALLERLERLLERAERLVDAPPASDMQDEAFFREASAFRWISDGRGGRFSAIRHLQAVDLDDLKGIDEAKSQLVRNTRQFVEGHPANNVLLWGEKGTGKSSSVKGLLSLFSDRGLRVIEVRRDDLRWLPVMMEQLRSVPLRFIIFCDDLAFQQPDQSYQELKALLEGGLEAPPENVLVYATSNRRHLLPEPMSDNNGGEIHPEEAVSEKLSLADRFGLHLSFYRVNQETYLEMVRHYAAQRDLAIAPEALRKEALLWAMYRGGRSGRSARQFIDDLEGRIALGDAG